MELLRSRKIDAGLRPTIRNGRLCKPLRLLSSYFCILYRSLMVLKCRHVVNGRQDGRLAANLQGPSTKCVEARRLPALDRDFDNGCLSKGDIPRREETPHRY